MADSSAPLCDERSSEGSARDLYTAIMNLPCKPPFYGKYSAEYRAYRMGYHDARRAAAELALASPSPQLSSLSLEGEREAFERHHCNNVAGLVRRDTTTGDYVLPSINDAWAGFQTRAAMKPQS